MFRLITQQCTRMRVRQDRVSYILLISSPSPWFHIHVCLLFLSLQRKRLAIAVQLLSMPNIIFLDEPTSGIIHKCVKLLDSRTCLCGWP